MAEMSVSKRVGEGKIRSPRSIPTQAKAGLELATRPARNPLVRMQAVAQAGLERHSRDSSTDEKGGLERGRLKVTLRNRLEGQPCV